VLYCYISKCLLHFLQSLWIIIFIDFWKVQIYEVDILDLRKSRELDFCISLCSKLQSNIWISVFLTKVFERLCMFFFQCLLISLINEFFGDLFIHDRSNPLYMSIDSLHIHYTLYCWLLSSFSDSFLCIFNVLYIDFKSIFCSLFWVSFKVCY